MKRRWPIIVGVAIAFVAFIWPIPCLDSGNHASIAIGAIWPLFFWGRDAGIAATSYTMGWMLIGLVLGGAIGYRLQRRKEAKQ